VLWQPIIIPVWEGLRILKYFGEYAIILYVDSSKCINKQIVTALTHNYNTDKWAMEYYIITLHIGDMVTFLHSSLLSNTVEYFGVIWGILLFYEDRVIIVETSYLLMTSSTFNITPSGLWTRSFMLQIGVMAAY
jgi:hypothetical protein